MKRSKTVSVGFWKTGFLLPLFLFTAPGAGDDLESPNPPAPYVNTSLMLNGNFDVGPAFWDRKGRQEPAKGSHNTYDPEKDPGFNKFEFANHCLVLMPSEELIQRILLSPGDNFVSGWSSHFRPNKNKWSIPEPFSIHLFNPHNIHVMHTLELHTFNTRKTRFSRLHADCRTEAVSRHELRWAIREELGFILRLHLETATVLDPPPGSLFPFPGIHQYARFEDYDDLDSLQPMRVTIIPSPSAELYLKAALYGFDEYLHVAYRHALGVLSSLCPCGPCILPCRYAFDKSLWEAPKAGQMIHMANLLDYFCDC